MVHGWFVTDDPNTMAPTQPLHRQIVQGRGSTIATILVTKFILLHPIMQPCKCTVCSIDYLFVLCVLCLFVCSVFVCVCIVSGLVLPSIQSKCGLPTPIDGQSVHHSVTHMRARTLYCLLDPTDLKSGLSRSFIILNFVQPLIGS